MKKVLILGGTGAMGVYLVDILNKTNEWDIHVTSRSLHIATGNVTYIQGNARNHIFLEEILQTRYDSIIDFMNYDYDEMAARIIKLLSSTDHYIWFSSSRVYANSDSPLTESSPRLLETTTDKAFLATNRYALRKARQEELIVRSGYFNYTIIRPYITYSDSRLQLGIYEKEQWLYRILKGRDLVINKNILNKKTTLTLGYDVAVAVSKCVTNPKALGKILQIASRETMTWNEILHIYLSVVKEKTAICPKIYLCDTMEAIDEIYEGGYNTIYDRVYNRSFDSSLIDRVIGEPIKYQGMKEGLHDCVSNFIEKDMPFLKIDWNYEALQDYLLDCKTPATEIPTKAEQKIYEAYRNADLSRISRLERNLEIVNINI